MSEIYRVMTRSGERTWQVLSTRNNGFTATYPDLASAENAIRQVSKYVDETRIEISSVNWDSVDA